MEPVASRLVDTFLVALAGDLVRKNMVPLARRSICKITLRTLKRKPLTRMLEKPMFLEIKELGEIALFDIYPGK